jgi:hypothetical protein
MVVAPIFSLVDTGYSFSSLESIDNRLLEIVIVRQYMIRQTMRKPQAVSRAAHGSQMSPPRDHPNGNP